VRTAFKNPIDTFVSWHLRLLRTPLEFLSDDGTHVNGVKLAINRLTGGDGKWSEEQGVEATGETEILPCGLVLRSVGYRGIPIDSAVPFDDQRGILPNDGTGRVDGQQGLYCTGWIATGPRGVIVDTMNKAYRVGESVLEDLKARGADDSKPGRAALQEMISARGRPAVSWDDWLRVDAAERGAGEAGGKPREKMLSVDEMRRVAFAS